MFECLPMEDFKENGAQRLCDINYFSYPSKDSQVTHLDIGVDSTFDISVKNCNKIDVWKRKMKSAQTKRQFTSFNPSIPLCSPNNFKATSSCNLCKAMRMPSAFQRLPKSEDHCRNLKDEHLRIFHASLLEVPNLKSTINPFIKASQIDYQHSLYQKRLTPKNFPHLISDYISDIPKSLLLQLFDEALMADLEELEENTNLKNCLASCMKDGRLFIFCPSGQHMDVVTVKEIMLEIEEVFDDEKPAKFKMMKSKECLKNHVDFLIQEIIFQNVLYVRGNYCCSIYSFNHSACNCHLTLLHKVSFEKLVHGIGINPFSLNELFIVSGDGSIFWYPNFSQPADVFDNLFSKPMAWHACVYGQSRNTCLVSNENDITLYDFRMKISQSQMYLDVSSEYFSAKDKFSPVLQWSPINMHQYITCTDQAMIICDERYLKTPLTQVNHYLKSSPRFLQMDIFAQSELMVIIGSYKSAESVIIELCSNGMRDHSLRMPGKLSCNNPWVVKQPLYKLSNYSEWKSYSSDWRMSLSITDRLSQPCIGVLFSPLHSMYNKEVSYYSFLQQSLFGDLFFQQLLSETVCNKDVFESVSLTKKSAIHEKSLIETCSRRCNEWLDYIVNTKCKTPPHNLNDPLDCHQGNGEHIESCSESNAFEFKDIHRYGQFEVSKLYGQMDYVSKLHECVAGTARCSIYHNSIDCFCISCGREYGDKLSQLKSEGMIVSRRSLEVEKIDDSSLLTTADDFQLSDKPLNNLFNAQWNSNEYIPLEEFAPYVAFDKSGFDNN